MYSRINSDGSMVRLFTEDFTFVIWHDRSDTKGVITDSVVTIDYDGGKIIRTSADVRALAYLRTRFIRRECIRAPDCMFREIRNMLSGYGCYYIPHSDQTRIMKLLEAVLY